MKIEVNIESGKQVFCLVEAQNVYKKEKQVVHGILTDNFTYFNGVVLYEIEDLNDFCYHRVPESDFLENPDEELKRVDEFFNSFEDLNDEEKRFLRKNVMRELHEIRRKKQPVSAS